MYGQYDHASAKRGAVFLCTLCPPPPPPPPPPPTPAEQYKTGTIRKHYNRTTEYAKTGLEQQATFKIHVLVCGLKKLNCGDDVVRGNVLQRLQKRFSACQGMQSRCALCHERLGDVHSHPGQWKCELQQFLLRYTDIPLSSCVQG